ncbi:MAG: sterol desaturase family protein, partial [Hyphomicrobiaceae bacterium]
MSVESVLHRFLHYFDAATAPTSRIFPLYLLSALLLAFVAYIQIERTHAHEGEPHGEREAEKKTFLQYVFDPKIIFHPSTRQDVKYFFVNAFVYYALISQFLISVHVFSTVFHSLMTGAFGDPSIPLLSSNAGIVLYTVLAVIAIDLGVFIVHYMMHRVPFLWEFHKVHHSAEELNPMTLFRMHPVDLFLTGLSVAILSGLAFAGVFYLTGSQPGAMTIFGLNIITFLFYLFGYNLRHTHIWLNYPYWLSKILVSPAQHQIHHSSDPKHFDRNMGLIFSFWDQLMGTSYIPREREKLSYGLSREEPNPFRSITDLYLKPFVWSWAILKERLAIEDGRRNALVV